MSPPTAPSERFLRLRNLWQAAHELEPARPDRAWPGLIERVGQVVRAHPAGAIFTLRRGKDRRCAGRLCKKGRFEPMADRLPAPPAPPLAVGRGTRAFCQHDGRRLVGTQSMGSEMEMHYHFEREAPAFGVVEATDLVAALDGLWRVSRWMALWHGLLPRGERLAPREREVLTGLLRGASEREIATEMGLTEASLHQLVVTVYRKLEVSSRAELLALWLS